MYRGRYYISFQALWETITEQPVKMTEKFCFGVFFNDNTEIFGQITWYIWNRSLVTLICTSKFWINWILKTLSQPEEAKTKAKTTSEGIKSYCWLFLWWFLKPTRTRSGLGARKFAFKLQLGWFLNSIQHNFSVSIIASPKVLQFCLTQFFSGCTLIEVESL